ncbi:MAG: DsrE family protein [Roseococcus sp.]|nr:DsrE family protein [Roseococcus sp.]
MSARRLAALALALALSLPGMARAEAPPRVLALVTSSDPQVQGMAFVLLNQMRQQGVTVEVMLCGAAGDLARREPPEAAPLRPLDATPAQMFRTLVQAGVRAEVCALYLPNAGLGPEALIEGVRPAAPPEMARRMLAAATRVLPF